MKPMAMAGPLQASELTLEPAWASSGKSTMWTSSGVRQISPRRAMISCRREWVWLFGHSAMAS